MYASDGRVHLIKCELCPVQDGHASLNVRVFLDAMKRLGWAFYKAEDGSYDTICPDCQRQRKTEKVPEIVLGR